MKNYAACLTAIISVTGALFLTACDAGDEQGPAYELAQKCYALKAVDNNSYLVARDNDNYQFSNVSAAVAEKFFLKPSGLGAFMLYDRNGRYLNVTDLLAVKRNGSGTDKAVWEINHTDIYKVQKTFFGTKKVKTGTAYTLVSRQKKMRMIKKNSQPALMPATEIFDAGLGGFYFVSQPESACKKFPEAELDAVVSAGFNEPIDPVLPVRGFVDAHTHLGFPKSMAAVAMAGDLFHPLGIEQALKNCSGLHGADGKIDLLEAGFNGHATHPTAGYPDFTYWPNRTTATHVMAYYKWIQRAYLSGMRITVTFVTGHQTLCELLSLIHPLKAQGNCTSRDVIKLQTDYIYQLQDYIDAQEGGPGKGWFRIVKSPEEARKVISQNKLAVLLGTEYNTIFDCKVGSAYCTPEYIDKELDALYDRGIRVIYPIHKFDNAFGGHKAQEGSAGAWFNLTNKLNTGNVNHLLDIVNPAKLLFKPITGNYWEYEKCPEGVMGTTNMANMEKFMNEDFIVSRNMLNNIPVVGPGLAQVLDIFFLDKLEPLPKYEEFDGTFHGCNVRGLQPAGRHLIKRMMDKGMILEVDHMDYKMLLEVLDMLEQRQYSGFVSSHGWMEDSAELRSRIFALGGIVTPMGGSASGVADRIEKYIDEMNGHPYMTGIGFGTDVQGMCAQGDGGTVTYPFASYDGTVTFTRPKTGNRTFNYNAEGRAHYGMLPEWLEAIRRIDEARGGAVMDTVMNSAEAYLQMWERAISGK